MRVFFVFAVFGALLLYSTGISAPYHLDDQNVIEISQHFGWQTRPFGFGSFWLNGQILPLARPLLPWRTVFYYRFGNVMLHAIAATALFWLICELTRRKDLAAIGGALFLVHPIQTQAVTYISQRFESQAAMFMLLSAAAFVRFRRTGLKGWLAAAIVSGGAAGLTKETAIILPIWLLFIELVFFEGAQLRKWMIYMAPLGIVIAIPAWRVFWGSGKLTLGWIPYDQFALTEGAVLTKYFELVTWPRRQFLYYDFQPLAGLTWRAGVDWLLVFAVAALGFYLLRRQRLIGFGILSFFIVLLPVIVLPVPDLINEHRLYGAFAGVAIAVAGIFQAVNRKWALPIIGVVVILLGIKTAMRNADWNDQIQFMELHRQAFPHEPQILTRLASYYYQAGSVNKALELNLEARKYEDRTNTYYRQQIHVLTAINLSSLYLAKGNAKASKTEALRAVAAKPTERFAWRALGFAELRLEEYKEAQSAFQRYADLAPGLDSWTALEVAATRAGDTKAAEAAAKLSKADQEKVSQEEARTPVIPQKYNGYAIFVLTMGLVAAVLWSLWTVWSAIRPYWPSKRPEVIEKSTKFGGEV